ncbi:hypothetical protein [uncultured Thiodictyon sp.]|uniref:hypothetical protein n=1 Tax=uncultured Thiodictyon sp. TaxID=1846217 RepID=UPI0025D693C2|nr:hypothetical protein [uncultured Thiodictyon sp.]
MTFSVRASLVSRYAAVALLAGSITAYADVPAFGPPSDLSFSGDSLHLVPPKGATVTHYAIQYTTQARLAAGERWGVWARRWPASVPAIDLAAAQTKAGCESQGPGAECNRPEGLGEHAKGQTFIYRVYAKVGDQWSAASPNLSVTRP